MAYKLTFTSGGEQSNDYQVTEDREQAELDAAEAKLTMAPMLEMAEILGIEYSFDIEETDEAPGVYFDGVLQGEE